MKTHRLFFALWPSDQVRCSIAKALSQLPQQLKGRVIRSQNLHITLHFIGSVTEDIKDCLHEAAQSVQAEAFQLDFEHFGHFPRAKIFWMGCRELPAELKQLHNKLGSAIETCGYQQDKRAYSPHITLMRKCVKPKMVQSDFSIPWFVDEFVLIESETHQDGVIYKVIEKYSLS